MNTYILRLTRDIFFHNHASTGFHIAATIAIAAVSDGVRSAIVQKDIAELARPIPDLLSTKHVVLGRHAGIHFTARANAI